MKSITAYLFVFALCVVAFQAARSFSGPSAIFSSRDSLAQVVLESQGNNGLFKDLENTFYSVSSLQLLKNSVPKTALICEAVETTLKASESSVADLYYATKIAKALSCKVTTTQATSQLSNKVSSKNNQDVYFAISALNALDALSSVDKAKLDQAANFVLQLKEEDGSFRSSSSESSEGTNYDAGLALLTLSQITSHVSPKIKDEISRLAIELDNLIGKATTHDKVLFFEDDSNDHQQNLKATSVIVQGFNAFASASGKKIDLSQEQISKFAEFFVENQNVQALQDIYYEVSGLHAIAENPFFTPLVSSVASDTLVLKSTESNIKIKVTDLFGKFATPSKVSISSIAPFNSPKSPIIKNQDFFPDDKDESKNTGFSFNFLALKPEPGLYSVRFNVNPSNKKYISSSEERVVRVVSGVSLQECIIQTTDDAESLTDSSKLSCDSGKVDDVIRNVYTPFVRVSFKIRNQASGKPAPVQQAFVRLFNIQTQQESIYVAKVGDKNTYTAALNLTTRHLVKNHLPSGKYSLEIIVGDSFIQTAIIHPIADVQITSHESKPTNTNLSPKPLISHVFRQPEKRPSEFFSLIWTAVVLLPFLVLFFGLIAVGGNLRNFPTDFSFFYAVGFHASLGLIFALFGLFWLRLNMFEALGYLSLLIIPTTFLGQKTLQALSTKH